MDSKKLLYQMCHEALTDVDIRAIGRARGFSSQEVSSRSQLETYFLSNIGVEKVLRGLNSAEIATLHLLRIIDKPINIETLQRLYAPDFTSAHMWNPTFTKRYQETFKAVRKGLVRKGVLIMTEVKKNDSTKMERLRFFFPAEFMPYLPPPFDETHTLATEGETRHDVARDKLRAVLKQTAETSNNLHSEYDLKLTQGRLMLSDDLFSEKKLKAWQAMRWRIASPPGKQRKKYSSDIVGERVDVLESLVYGLTQLPPQQWVSPAHLKPVLTIFTDHTYELEQLCECGYEWGYLARNRVNNEKVYRLAASTQGGKTPAPADYFTSHDGQSVQINLTSIPYAVLTELNQIVTFSLENQQLVAVPNLVEMGKSFDNLMGNPSLQWLIKHVAAFEQAYKTLKRRWGKQIVHTNLLVAHVPDVVLRVKIEHTLKSNEVVILSEEYIAFPPKLLPKIERIVQREGHVVKHGSLS